MNRSFYSSLILVSVSLFLILSGCKKDEAPTAPQNHLPNIESLTANPTTVLISTETTLTCIATDEDGDNLTITWSSKRGTFSNGVVGIAVKWIAPLTTGKDTITATVNDGKQTIQGKLEIIVGTISASPTLLTPSNNATEIALSPALSWNAVTNAVSYTLQVSTSNSFSSFVFNQNSLTNTSQQITSLSNATSYYWRVSASNSYGSSSWSNYWTFTTIIPPCPSIPTVSYAGKIYNTVQIGTQCWLRENLDVGTMIQGNQNPSNNGTIEKYCYNNDPNNCNTYGGLYLWNEAMAYSTTSGTKGICPTGWHIPTEVDFQSLSTIVSSNGNSLKAIGQGTESGAGTNASGFSALLQGSRQNWGTFSNLGYTYLWSSTEFSSTTVRILYLTYNSGDIYFADYLKNDGYVVRCLKD